MHPATIAKSASRTNLLGKDDITLFHWHLAPVAKDVGNHKVLAGNRLTQTHLSDKFTRRAVESLAEYAQRKRRK